MSRKIGQALVVGAGISGIRASIDLAQMGYGVTLIERAAHMGGVLSQLDHQFPTNHCGMCRMLPMTDRDAGIQTCLRKGLFHDRIEILLGTTLEAVDGDPGNFEVTLNQRPRTVDPDRCIGCGACAAVCPVEVPDAFNAGLSRRKAIYLPVPHTMPNTYTVDLAACTRCGACEPACPTGAIRLTEAGRRAFRILVVDDEAIVRDSLRAWLGDEEGYTVETAASGPEALERLAAESYSLMLLDIKMPGMDGVTVIEQAGVVQPGTAVLMMTAYATVETAVEAMKIGAMDYLIKPFDPEDLLPKVAAVFQRFEASRHLKRQVGAVVLATGTAAVDPAAGKNAMGYGTVPNVVTGLELERMLSGSGPDAGRLLRPSDRRPVKRAAWIQCVGSRDMQSGADFCSTTCCMFALKEADLARRLAGPDFEATIIYMDLRSFGKSFERYRQAITEGGGMRLVRGRVHSIAPTPGSDDVTLHWVTSSGEPVNETVDLVVLSVGQRPADGTAALAERLGVATDDVGFLKTEPFSETRTRRPGILVGGSLTGPADIAESTIRSSSAAVNASRVVHRAGGGLMEAPAPTAVDPETLSGPPRIQVIACRCHQGRGAAENDARPAEALHRLAADPAVERVTVLENMCTTDGWKALGEVAINDANRLLIGACRPFTHGRGLRDLAAVFGLPPAVVDTAVLDTGRDADMAAAGAALLAGIARLKNVRLDEEVPPAANPRVLVVGGGIAGMHAALAVADHGVPVTLVETADRLGGNLTWLHQTIDGTPTGPFLAETIDRIDAHAGIRVMTDSRVVGAFGRSGAFFSSVESAAGATETIEHGAVIIATGGREATTDSYAYGASPAVVTQRELEQRMADGNLDAAPLTAVAMILCVDSREEPRNYCSRVCCPTALKQALWLKARNPDTAVYILYRDMMTCGLAEAWFTEARRQGVLFFPYAPDAKPQVAIADDGAPPVSLRLHDPILDAPLEITADLLVLATGIRADLPDALVAAYGVQRDRDGFFAEADSKWRPVEGLQTGVFACGIALSPRSIPEAISTAEAAAGRTLALLAGHRVQPARTTATVRHSLCTLCLRCIDTCPYGARFLDDNEAKIRIDPAMCQGCGDCATVCPNDASIVAGFTPRTVFGAIEGAVAQL